MGEWSETPLSYQSLYVESRMGLSCRLHGNVRSRTRPKMRVRFTHPFILGPSFNKTMEPLLLHMRHLKSVPGIVTGHYYVKTPVKFVIVFL